MIQKVNLKENVNAIDGLFLYKRVGTLNNHMLNVLQAEHRSMALPVNTKRNCILTPSGLLFTI